LFQVFPAESDSSEIAEIRFLASPSASQLEKKALVKRKNTDDRRVRMVELRAKGRALVTKIFREHATTMEEAAGVLTKQERLILLRILKKLGKGAEQRILAKP